MVREYRRYILAESLKPTRSRPLNLPMIECVDGYSELLHTLTSTLNSAREHIVKGKPRAAYNKITDELDTLLWRINPAAYSSFFIDEFSVGSSNVSQAVAQASQKFTQLGSSPHGLAGSIGPGKSFLPQSFGQFATQPRGLMQTIPSTYAAYVEADETMTMPTNSEFLQRIASGSYENAPPAWKALPVGDVSTALAVALLMRMVRRDNTVPFLPRSRFTHEAVSELMEATNLPHQLAVPMGVGIFRRLDDQEEQEKDHDD